MVYMKWFIFQPPESETGPRRFLGSVPYDPRVKKSKSKLLARRTVLQLGSTSVSESIPQGTAETSLPGNKLPFGENMPQTISEYKKMQTFHLEKEIESKPYVRKQPSSASNNKWPQSVERMTKANQGHSSQTGASTQRSSNNVHSASKHISSSSTAKVQYVHPHTVKHTTKNKTDNKPMYGPTINEHKVKKTELYLQARG